MDSPPSPDSPQPHEDYARIAGAIAFLRDHYTQQPDLQALAEHLGLSPHHTQRLFARWAGVSPKRFVQFLSKEHARQLLQSHSVLDTALALGFSGSSRLHDLLVSTEAVSPGDVTRQGAGLCITHGVCTSPFGHCFVAVTPRGLCQLGFFDHASEQALLLARLQADWPMATLQEDHATATRWGQQIFRLSTDACAPLHLLLKGSPFQLQVWQALLRIPTGQVVSYGDLAKGMGRPEATRAVASAIAANRLGYLIPCHRVIRQSGDTHHYRWGPVRKQVLLAWEQAQSDPGCDTP